MNSTWFTRLISGWPYGGFLSGVLLLALFPLLTHGWPETLQLTFLFLPLYMIHQYEEHDNDRFRRFVNNLIGHGREVLSPLAVFIINIPGVWGVIAVTTYLSAWVAPGLGLCAVYLTIVNGLAHIGPLLAFRKYNPGLATSLLLFLPAGIYAIVRFNSTGAGGWIWHGIGIGTALLIHIAIIAYCGFPCRVMAKNRQNETFPT